MPTFEKDWMPIYVSQKQIELVINVRDANTAVISGIAMLLNNELNIVGLIHTSELKDVKMEGLLDTSTR
jgi:hypothetical protein